jgi:hypothetical protein
MREVEKRMNIMNAESVIVAAIELGTHGVLQIVIAGRDERELASANSRITDALGEILALDRKWKRDTTK